MIKVREEEGGQAVEEIIERSYVKRIEEERRKKIEDSIYNALYKDMGEEKIPKYLEDRRKAKKKSLIARFRLGNKMKARLYWLESEDRLYRVCGEKKEKAKHVMYECVETIRVNQDIFDERRKGVERMKKILEKKREAEKRREREMTRKGNDERMNVKSDIEGFNDRDSIMDDINY